MTDDRGRVQYVDVVLAFSTVVSFVAVAPWVYQGVAMGSDVVDPLSSVLLDLALPVFVIAMIVSLAVSGRSG